MKILSVVGARPQFIKAWVVSKELRKSHDEVLVHTGQHYDEEMSDVFFDELGIPKPEYNLGVGSGKHGEQTAAMIAGLEEVALSVDPDVLLCYGDTNSTLAAGIVGSKIDAELAHVEAGIRSFKDDQPEEINRVLTDHASDHLFVPSRSAVEHLRAEGIEEGVHFVGDVMYESLHLARERAQEHSSILDKLDVEPDEFVLTTVHRPRNTDNSENLENIVRALADQPDPVVFPAHPRTVEALENSGLLTFAREELTLVDPVGYVDFVRLMDASARIATDSGGIQKEAFFLDTPCVTFREETEWEETLENDWNVLVGAEYDDIQAALQTTPDTNEEKPEPYGERDATSKIRRVLESES